MRAVIALSVGVMLLTPAAAAENKSHMEPLKNVGKAKAETQKELTRNLRRDAPPQGPKSNTQTSSSKAK